MELIQSPAQIKLEPRAGKSFQWLSLPLLKEIREVRTDYIDADLWNDMRTTINFGSGK